MVLLQRYSAAVPCELGFEADRIQLFFWILALTECETHNLPSGGFSYLKDAHLCFPDCIFRRTSHTVRFTRHIPKISLMPLTLSSDSLYTMTLTVLIIIENLKK